MLGPRPEVQCPILRYKNAWLAAPSLPCPPICFFQWSGCRGLCVPLSRGYVLEEGYPGAAGGSNPKGRWIDTSLVLMKKAPLRGEAGVRTQSACLLRDAGRGTAFRARRAPAGNDAAAAQPADSTPRTSPRYQTVRSHQPHSAFNASGKAVSRRSASDPAAGGKRLVARQESGARENRLEPYRFHRGLRLRLRAASRDGVVGGIAGCRSLAERNGVRRPDGGARFGADRHRIHPSAVGPARH